MEKATFLRTFVGCLVLDFLLLISTPMFGYLSLAAFLIYTPVTLSYAAPDAVKWLRSEHPKRCVWWALGRSLSGSSLIFLVGALTLTACSGPSDDWELWAMIGFVFLFLGVFRMLGAALVNLLLAPIVFFAAKEPLTRLDALSAGLCSWAGLYLWGKGFEPEFLRLSTLTEPLLYAFEEERLISTYVMVGVFLVVSSLSGLVWGATVHWIARTMGRK